MAYPDTVDNKAGDPTKTLPKTEYRFEAGDRVCLKGAQFRSVLEDSGAMTVTRVRNARSIADVLYWDEQGVLREFENIPATALEPALGETPEEMMDAPKTRRTTPFVNGPNHEETNDGSR